ncbi:hypothetical protein [Mesorhizobium sp.]|uniref:hypothetical protein n=1 Tax=Mesorhizobium sp. TaxID=1871066 RepID=UPI0025F21D60|nr:hypothetical protein [Mesorhizobium sp.]
MIDSDQGMELSQDIRSSRLTQARFLFEKLAIDFHALLNHLSSAHCEIYTELCRQSIDGKYETGFFSSFELTKFMGLSAQGRSGHVRIAMFFRTSLITRLVIGNGKGGYEGAIQLINVHGR